MGFQYRTFKTQKRPESGATLAVGRAVGRSYTQHAPTTQHEVAAVYPIPPCFEVGQRFRDASSPGLPWALFSIFFVAHTRRDSNLRRPPSTWEISPEVPCPRRPPAKSACLEGPILEAHIGTLHSPAVSHLLSDTTFPQLGILRVPLFVPVLAGFLLRTTQVRSAPVSNWQPLPFLGHVATPRLLGASGCQPGDWMCRACNNHNYADKLACNRCK
ncbi:hypothetical protein EMIHUDRAFT_72018, partial [Emiliania huxleyi CCMP1516]|uniref:RanBP2-type domain-containing protein n=2 Tax=Emiliania huxleyi TaxID=2903 RepID=A0A0D3K9T7_EMIH1